MSKKRIQLGPHDETLKEMERVRLRLEHAEATLRAIHSGEVDAIIIQTDQGEKVYTFAEAERPYRILIEEMSQGAVTLDRHGDILYCNKFFASLLKTPSEALIGVAFQKLLRSNSMELWQRILSTQERISCELDVVVETEVMIPVHVTGSPLVAHGDMHLGLIITDLRPLRQTEAILNERAESEKTARKEAERLYGEVAAASRLKDEFLATLSHELRTPLNAILGYSDLLVSNLLSASEVHHAIDIIHRSAAAQARIIDDLLDVSAITSGQLTLDMSLVSLGEVIDNAIEAVRLGIDAKGISLSTHIYRQIPLTAKGDALRLQQVMWNLLSNAVKFTPRGGSIRVELAPCGDSAIITVKDTGQGIGHDFLPFVFNRFRQEDGSYTRRHGGLGLGLSIVRYLVEAHGGKVEAASDGSGATFTVTLPLVPAQVSTLDEPRSGNLRIQQSDEAQDRLAGRKALIIDDDLDSRQLASVLLGRVGAHVEAVASVDEAVRILPDFQPDVILCDLGMPDRDGYDFVRHVRGKEQNEGREIPIIALTGFAQQGVREHLLESGFNSYITKPIQILTLLNEVQRFVAPEPS